MRYLLLLFLLVPSLAATQPMPLLESQHLAICVDNYTLAFTGAQVAQQQLKNEEHDEQTRKIVDIAFERALISMSCTNMEGFEPYAASLQKVLAALYEASDLLYCLEWVDEGQDKLKRSLEYINNIDGIVEILTPYSMTREQANRYATKLLGESIYAFQSAKRFCDDNTISIINKDLPYYEDVYNKLTDDDDK